MPSHVHFIPLWVYKHQEPNNLYSGNLTTKIWESHSSSSVLGLLSSLIVQYKVQLLFVQMKWKFFLSECMIKADLYRYLLYMMRQKPILNY
jgi:hypothetical protein